MAVDGWAVTFGTARRRLGGAATGVRPYARPDFWGVKAVHFAV